MERREGRTVEDEHLPETLADRVHAELCAQRRFAAVLGHDASPFAIELQTVERTAQPIADDRPTVPEVRAEVRTDRIGRAHHVALPAEEHDVFAGELHGADRPARKIA